MDKEEEVSIDHLSQEEIKRNTDRLRHLQEELNVLSKALCLPENKKKLTILTEAIIDLFEKHETETPETTAATAIILMSLIENSLMAFEKRLKRG